MPIGDEETGFNDSLGERVYEGVKAYVMSVARPGQRLDMAALAQRQRASLTPVRAALNRLTGEDLVEAHLNLGFRTPPLSLSGLRDLYDLNRQLLVQASTVAKTRTGTDGIGTFVSSPERGVVRDVASLFQVIGRRSGNAEIERIVKRLNDRLHRVRMCELAVLGDGVQELGEMMAHQDDERGAGLRRAIQAYHRRRVKAIPDILAFAERR
jgi:DNA-binding GntR family transcriptional regulator